jgi:hypothetical protein
MFVPSLVVNIQALENEACPATMALSLALSVSRQSPEVFAGSEYLETRVEYTQFIR